MREKRVVNMATYHSCSAYTETVREHKKVKGAAPGQPAAITASQPTTSASGYRQRHQHKQTAKTAKQLEMTMHKNGL
ncbi:unnamed protein product [Enterobius vermicularis]|uniref:Uncharacterized protein n=1 Tax=Enterobius vermicularis TaxID=51028 RepID=A0A0N4VFZ7_ENTVE|nr:unnamed protein product [Enterobius vermicularis]